MPFKAGNTAKALARGLLANNRFLICGPNCAFLNALFGHFRLFREAHPER